MAGQSGGLVGAWIVALTLVGAGCGYDNGSNPTGPGYGDTTARIAPAAAVGRSDFRVFTATGDIAPTLAEFRAALGDPLNGGTPGPLAAGRREIKWDGAPELMPGDFFNTTVKAGAIFTTDGTGFRNSAGDFGEINPAYADDFNAFSQPKTFMPIGSAELTGAGPGDPGGDAGLRARVFRRRARRGGLHQAVRRPGQEPRPVPRTGPQRCGRVLLRRRGVRVAFDRGGPDHVGPACAGRGRPGSEPRRQS